MILLTSTSDLVQVITGGTQAVKVHASYVDFTSPSTIAANRTNTLISTAATTTVVPSPGSSVSRNVKFLSVQNTDATNADTITIQHTDGTNVVLLFKISLTAGYTITYNDLAGWVVLDASGNQLVEAPLPVGRYLGTTITSSASGTFTTQAATTKIKIRGIAGGGGGGGCTSVASGFGAAGGGGSGSYLEKTVAVSGSTGYAYVAGGGGGGNSGAAGGTGSNSTFVVGSTTYTCNGGGGAAAVTSSTTAPLVGLGGTGGAVSTNGDVNVAGSPGYPGMLLSTTVGVSGNGANSELGSGGIAVKATGTGGAATNYGAGGAGGVTLTSSTAATGGSGTTGVWIIDEYS